MRGVIASLGNVGKIRTQQGFCGGRVTSAQDEDDGTIKIHSGIPGVRCLREAKHMVEIADIFTIGEKLGRLHIRFDVVRTLIRNGLILRWQMLKVNE